jgi:hypothetical protein
MVSGLPPTPPAARPLDLPPRVVLPLYPARSDCAGWSRWWESYRQAFREAGATADGILDEPAPSSCDSAAPPNVPPAAAAAESDRDRERRELLDLLGDDFADIARAVAQEVNRGR